MAGVYVALGLVTAAWVMKAVAPSPASNAAGWVFGVVGTIVALLAALGIAIPHHIP